MRQRREHEVGLATRRQARRFHLQRGPYRGAGVGPGNHERPVQVTAQRRRDGRMGRPRRPVSRHPHPHEQQGLHEQVVILAEHPQHLLAQGLGQGIQPAARRRRHVGVQPEVPILVLRPGELIVRAGVDDTANAVAHRGCREMIVAAQIDGERLVVVVAQHRQIDDGVHPLGGGEHRVAVGNAQAPVLVLKRRRRVVHVSDA